MADKWMTLETTPIPLRKISTPIEIPSSKWTYLDANFFKYLIKIFPFWHNWESQNPEEIFDFHLPSAS